MIGKKEKTLLMLACKDCGEQLRVYCDKDKDAEQVKMLFDAYHKRCKKTAPTQAKKKTPAKAKKK